MRNLLAPLTLALSILGVALTGFTVSAYAADAASPDQGNLLDLARPIFDQIMAGHYLAATAFALVLCVALLKRYAPASVRPYVHSDAGGALTTLGMAFFGALATATMGGAPWSWAIVTVSLTIAVTAAGGYAVLKKTLVEPILRPLMDKAPPWLKPILALVMWIFDKAPSAEAKATAAGNAAVAATPSTGVTSVAGEPKDL